VVGRAIFDRIALYPFGGFSFVGESYTFDNVTDRDVYLARRFGVHFTFDIDDRSLVRVTVDENSFRRETYRAARAAYIRRF
jgi:cytidylate kinase